MRGYESTTSPAQRYCANVSILLTHLVCHHHCKSLNDSNTTVDKRRATVPELLRSLSFKPGCYCCGHSERWDLERSMWTALSKSFVLRHPELEQPGATPITRVLYVLHNYMVFLAQCGSDQTKCTSLDAMRGRSCVNTSSGYSL